MEEKYTMYQRAHKCWIEHPRLMAIYYQGKKISFRKFNKLVDRMADILYNRFSLRRNDVILIAQPNIPEALILFYAANKIGVICNFVHPFTPFNQIKTIINKTNSKVAFLFEQRVAKEVEKYRELADKVVVTRIETFLPFFKKMIYHLFYNRSIRKTLGRWRGSFKGFTYLHKFKPTGQVPETVTDKYEDTSVLLHSGSTTGDPKTICLSDKNFRAIERNTFEILGCKQEFVYGKNMLSVLPSFHGFGLCMTMHIPLSNGFGVILVPKYSAKEVVKIMKKVKVLTMCAVPTMLENLVNYPEFQKTKRSKYLHVVYCGGDALPEKTRTAFEDIMKSHGSYCRVFEGYGLTEAIAVNCVNTYAHNKVGSIGWPITGSQFSIMDENDNPLPPHQLGEIAIKGESVMDHYFNDPVATEKTIRNGWLYTGDIGYMDEDGFVYFSQRKKRVIKVSGVGVFPSEIEKLIESIPGVERACAIQIPDARLQHAVKVFVVAKFFDEEGMKNQILDTCRKYLIRWSVPKEIEFRESLPLTMLGKIDFKTLQLEENQKRGVKDEN